MAYLKYLAGLIGPSEEGVDWFSEHLNGEGRGER